MQLVFILAGLYILFRTCLVLKGVLDRSPLSDFEKLLAYTALFAVTFLLVILFSTVL